MKRLVIIVIFVAISFNCGNNTDLNGTVTDMTNKGIDSVLVSIENSEYKTITDSNGQYELDFAPGQFNIVYSKKGFTTVQKSLNISEKVFFPIDTVTIYKIPDKQGIYYIKENLLTEIQPATYLRGDSKARYGVLGMMDHMYYLERIFTSDVKQKIHIFSSDQDTLLFIDTNESNFWLFKATEYGHILNFITIWGAVERTQNDGFIKDSVYYIGKERLLFRSIKNEPGLYAWIQMEKTLLGMDMPKKDTIAYVFKIE